MPDHDNNDQWTISKVINIGDIVAIVVALTALASVYSTLNSRISVLESGATRALADVAEIKADLKDLNRKLEQLIFMRMDEIRARDLDNTRAH